jgi:hypothetical protein
MAQARPRRNQRTDDDTFAIALDVALGLLLAPGHIAPGDTWYFQAIGTELIITRSRPTVAIPDPGPP